MLLESFRRCLRLAGILLWWSCFVHYITGLFSWFMLMQVTEKLLSGRNEIQWMKQLHHNKMPAKRTQRSGRFEKHTVCIRLLLWERYKTFRLQHSILFLLCVYFMLVYNLVPCSEFMTKIMLFEHSIVYISERFLQDLVAVWVFKSVIKKLFKIIILLEKQLLWPWSECFPRLCYIIREIPVMSVGRHSDDQKLTHNDISNSKLLIDQLCFLQIVNFMADYDSFY